MLLKQLVDYRPTSEADASPALPYGRSRFALWQLDIDSEGRFLGFTSLADPTDKARRNGVLTAVPTSTRSGPKPPPGVGADDIQYVLGWCDDKSDAVKVAHNHQASVALHQRWAEESPQDVAATAIARFYSRVDPSSLPRPSGWSSKDIVLIRVDGRAATDSDSLWELWKRVVEERKTGTGSGKAQRRGLCLVCGNTGVLLDRLPQAIKQTLVPRAMQEVALMPANHSVHTYDRRKNLRTAPICTDCGRAVVANLAAILDNRDNTHRYHGQRSVLAWWVTGGGDQETIALLTSDPEKITRYFERLQTGAKPRALHTERHQFCSITVTCSSGSRLVVQDWIEQPLEQAEEQVRQWFDDHQIADRWAEQPARFPIWRLLTCAGKWERSPGTSGSGRYVPLDTRSADRPDDLAELLLRSALHGTKLPPRVLGHVVRRVRTDNRIDEPRAALIRVALVRHANPPLEKPMAGLDPSNFNSAYLAGRLFAVLESIQRESNRSSDQPNSTFFDRYFAGAIGSPRIALVQGSQLSAAWLRKIRTSAEREHSPAERDRRLGVGMALSNRLTELFSLLDVNPLPAGITIEDQSVFILGYHHQRADDRARARAGRSPDSEQPSEPEDTDAEGTEDAF